MVRIIRKSKDIYASLDPIFHRQKKTTQMTGYLLLKSRNFSKIETTLPYQEVLDLDDLKQKRPAIAHLISEDLI
jgi:phenylalanine-4-hydroxylase